MRRWLPFRVGLGALSLLGFLVLSIPARAGDARDCGNGIRLRLSAPQASQGSLLLIDVQTIATTAKLNAEWSNHTLSLWRVSRRDNLQRGLIAIDLEHPAGKFKLNLSAELSDGKQVTCAAAVSVLAGHFAIESLHVEARFVQPAPEELERAKKETARLKEIFARVTAEKLWQGSFRMPITGTHTARNFGRRRVLNGQAGSPHTGVDIPALSGTPVHAPQRGRVVLAEPLFFSGNTVILDHGLGLYTFYGHLESISVQVGDLVAPGALLGKVGATGRVTGPHLHWGVTLNQSRVNPLQLLTLPAD